MTRKQPKPKRATPKPVEAWAVVDYQGAIVRWAVDGLETWAMDDDRDRLSKASMLEGDHIVPVRIVPIVKRTKRKERKK